MKLFTYRSPVHGAETLFKACKTPGRLSFWYSAVVALTISNLSPALAQQECLPCHRGPHAAGSDDSAPREGPSVDRATYAGSVHGDLSCVDCHEDVTESLHAETPLAVDCSACHDDILAEYQPSVHASSRRNGNGDPATCSDCHGKHDILPSANPESRTHPLNIAATCATCHSDPAIVREYHIPIANPLAAYEKSVHGVAVLSEHNFAAATCNSCHGSHGIRRMDDPESQVHTSRVASTCGQCHKEIAELYQESVHGTAVEQGIDEAPVCTDCHGEHQVKSATDVTSPVHPLRVSSETCGRCHASELINEKYGLPESQVETFEDSYHGLAIKGGSLSAANCASCHGIHNILPSSDPRSMVHPANLRNTCGACHPDATDNVAKGAVHLTTSTLPGRVVAFVKRFYIGLIVLVIGLMLLHNGIDLVHRGKKRIRKRERIE